MKAGDTAYLVESNRFVHEVEILRCNGELYIVCFKDNGVGLYFKAYHLLLTSWKTVKSISQILLGTLLQLYVGLQSRKCRGNP